MPYQGHYDGGGERDEQALLWIEDVTGRDHGSDSVQVALQDGVALCELAQHLVPGSIGKVSHSKMPFPQRENIAQFVAFCRDIGVPEYELFSTADLFEAKNMDQVVNCLWSLGQVAYKVASYEGPCLGPPPNGGGRRRHHTLTSKADTLAGKPGSGRSAAPIGGSGPAPGLDIRDTQTNAHKIRVTESRGTAALRQLQGRRSGAAHVADPDATGFRAKVQPRRDRLGGGPSQRPAKVAVTKKKGPPAIPHRSSAPPPIPHSSGSSASVSATHERRAQRALHEYLHSQGAEGDQLYDAYGELDALERLKQDHTQRTKTQETLHDVEQLQHLKQQGGTHGELLSVRDHIAQLRQEMGLETSSPSVVSPPAPAAEEVSAAADRAFEALVAQNPGATVIRDLAPPPGAGAGAEASSKYGLSGSLVSQGRGTVGQLAAREAEGILAQQDAARVQAVRGGLLRERQQSATARPRKPSLVVRAARIARTRAPVPYSLCPRVAPTA
jgi:hypothetical protein